jgi:hypothetical protein
MTPRTLVLALALLLIGPAPAGHAGSAPPDVGAFLQAGARLRESLVGHRVITHLALPGRESGLVLDLEGDHAPTAKAVERQTRELGKACAAGDTLVIRDVLVSRREIAVVFGAGGYREDDAVAFAPLRRSPIEEMASASAQRAAALQSALALDPGATASSGSARAEAQAQQARAEEIARGAARGREQSELTRVQERRHILSRTWGARVRLASRKDLPLPVIDPAVVRERLARALTVLD